MADAGRAPPRVLNESALKSADPFKGKDWESDASAASAALLRAIRRFHPERRAA